MPAGTARPRASRLSLRTTSASSSSPRSAAFLLSRDGHPRRQQPQLHRSRRPALPLPRPRAATRTRRRQESSPPLRLELMVAVPSLLPPPSPWREPPRGPVASTSLLSRAARTAPRSCSPRSPAGHLTARATPSSVCACTSLLAMARVATPSWQHSKCIPMISAFC
jgi:hypothetical protein